MGGVPFWGRSTNSVCHDLSNYKVKRNKRKNVFKEELSVYNVVCKGERCKRKCIRGVRQTTSYSSSSVCMSISSAIVMIVRTVFQFLCSPGDQDRAVRIAAD